MPDSARSALLVGIYAIEAGWCALIVFASGVFLYIEILGAPHHQTLAKLVLAAVFTISSVLMLRAVVLLVSEWRKL